MLKSNSELRAIAREKLTGKWLMAAIATFITMAIAGGFGAIPFLGWIGTLLIGLPVIYGFFILMLGLYRGAQDIDLGILFEGFKDFGRILGTALLQFVYIWLWSLLLIVPGIIKMYSYAMTYFILKDEPELANNAAIEKSMVMMEGNKMKLFLLDLSFIGWLILGCITCGIGLFWVYPYMTVAHAAFYEDLKAQQVDAEEIVGEALNIETC